jgi:hypothetical protein
MAIKALTGLVPEWYTPANQEGESEPARFNLKPLTSPQVAKLQSFFNLETGEISGSGLYESAILSIIGWENVTDHEGKALKCNSINAKKLPYEILIELGGVALSNSFLSDDDEKNS